MKTVTLIGIGTGHPDHITLAGVRAMQQVELVLVPRKGPGKDDLADLRRFILTTHAPETPVVEFDMPVRDAAGDYAQGVDAWHDRIAQIWHGSVPADAQHVGLLVWGDPSLYDSTLRIAARLSPRPVCHVVPGITALQALTAAHAIPLNTVNGPVLITTGRQLRTTGWPEGANRVAVMLDGECSFQSISPNGLHIWWGAFLGMPNEVLISGALSAVRDDILDRRARARADHGWIMDTYLMACDPG